MKIELTATELATTLAEGQAHELMVFLATLATHEDADLLIAAAADQHNGTDLHQQVAPWLRQMAVALDRIEARDAAIDAAGRVS